MNDDDLRLALDDLTRQLPPLGALPTTTAVRARRRRSAKLAGSGALAVALVAGGAGLAVGLGGGGDDRLDPPTRATSPTTAGPSTSPPPSPSMPPTAPSPPVPSEPPPPSPEDEPESGEQLRTSLQPDGLGVLTLPSGSNRMLLFEDTPADDVRTALEAALGDGVEAALPDCGARVVQVTYGDSVVVTFDGEAFVGWSVDADGPRLQTGDGIAAGSSLADLRAAYPAVEVTDGSLGREFTVPDGYNGILEGAGEDAVITFLAAGNACVFR